MGIFGYKNDTPDFLSMKKCSEYVSKELEQDIFISKRVYYALWNENKAYFDNLQTMQNNNVLSDYCKRNKLNYKQLYGYMDVYKNVESLVENHNNSFIKKALTENKEYLDNILKEDDPNIILDEEQRRVVLSDEDYTLVVAGAGAGKTTTVEAKVKYLIEKKNILPERILVISFTKKATNELKDRIHGKLKKQVNIATFHSIGNTIIKGEEESKHQIVDNGFMFDAVRNYLKTKLDDEYFIKKLVLFFASYLNTSFDERNINLLYKSLQANKFTTLKSDLVDALNSYKKELEKNRITLNEERVRSVEELKIANFLYINNIDYEYEPVYPYGFRDTIKPYCPDFVLKQGNRRVYLEHFGISESGTNNRFTQQELDTYKKHINDKVKLHREHNTELIYTFSKYDDNKDLISHLENKLLEKGFQLNRKDDMEIYKRLTETAEDKYFNKFVQLVCNFISKFKVNNFELSKFDEWKISLRDERTKLFVDIAYQCFLAYKTALKEANALDFSDMINDASKILDGYIKEGNKLPFDYIFVDEYQDISVQRFDLCERLSKCSDAKIIAVGDDWQSIYRFSGSKIGLFTQFEKAMPYASILKITNTYRNSQELINIAGEFVMKNNEQIKKDLHSPKHIDDPVLLMSYDDSTEKDSDGNGPYYRMGEAIEKAIEDIVLKCGEKKSILLIGRYNFDCRNLAKIEGKFHIDVNNRIVSDKYPNVQLNAFTAHSSKGLGFDNVIVINGKDDILGFPSKIQDDPIMQLVIKNDEAMDYAEERRLFYVALTRTKNRVYLITPIHHPSKFIVEIKDSFTNIIIKGKELTPEQQMDLRRKCPCCGYPLQLRGNKSLNVKSKKLWICSNDPELCGFISNDLTGGKLSILKCPECVDGYLIVKAIKKDGVDTGQRMLGCTNFKVDKTGCNFMMRSAEATSNKEIIYSKFMSDIDITKMIVFGYPIKEFVNKIINILLEVRNTYANFTFAPFSLADFIVGEKSKPITAFELNKKINNFGIVKKEEKNRMLVFLRHLEEAEIIAMKNDGEYKKVELVKETVSDDELIDLYRIFTDYQRRR